MSGSIIFLAGPTACGKSDLAMRLAARLPCEIVSVDSMLIYRGMDIGTAKPDAAARRRVPHHLVDICDPRENYSAAEFCADAHRAVARIRQAGRTPLLVGGTMFYFHALEHGLSPLPPADPALRSEIKSRSEDTGTTALHQWLKQLDPATAARIHPNDSQRVQRAIEVCILSGKPMSDLKPREAPSLGGTVHRFCLDFSDRSLLHRQIEARFDEMLERGLIDELAGLIVRGEIDAGCNAARGVGYRQAWRYLDGTLDYPEMRRRAIFASRQLAKRQLVWLRRMRFTKHYCVDQNPLDAITGKIEKIVATG